MAKPRIPPRLLAAVLLGCLAARLAWVGLHAAYPVAHALGSIAMLSLGGCLWWVAHRQVGAAGALVSLSLLVAGPMAASASGLGAGAGAAPGLFAMLYTAVGVAHALQGPRRKWAPRILLMAGLCGFTALVAPRACAVGLGLSLAAMLYLVEGRRRLLPGLFALWITAAGAGGGLRRLAMLHNLFLGTVNLHSEWRGTAALAPAGLAALVLWIGSGRSRYFGNTAPLLAAAVIAVAGLAAGPVSVFWALPFVLLFIGGVFADGLESGSKRLWIVIAAVAILLASGAANSGWGVIK